MKKLKMNIGFNVRLYLDGLRQLRIIGIMSAIIMAVAAFALPMYYNINNASYYKYHQMDSYNMGIVDFGREYTYSILRMNPYIILTFLVIVPLMTMMIFSFLNRRNACDFYHAVPVTRGTMVLSYGASVLTWNVGIVLESILISAFAGGVFQYVALDFKEVPVMICSMIAADLYMFAVFVISMSVTGTLLTNLCVAAMILVVPRALITYIVSVVTESIWVMDFHFGNSILDDRLNVVTNLVTGLFVRGQYDAWYSFRSVLYTLVVGLILCGIGIYLFRQRKSEAATQAAVTPRLQAVFRIVPAMLFSLIPICYFFQYVVMKDHDVITSDNESIFIICLMYLISLISIFLYEIITTRKLKNYKKALKSVVGLAVYNVVMLLVLAVFYNVMLNDIPKVENVQSIRIEGLDVDGKQGSSYDDSSYVLNQLKNIDIESEEFKQLIVSELARNVDCQKTGSDDGRYFTDPEWDYDAVRVTLDCVGSEKRRHIYLTKEASRQLLTLLSKEEKVRKLVYEPIPKNELIFSNSQISAEDVYTIYQAYMRDLGKLEFEDAFKESIGMGSEKEVMSWIPFETEDGSYYHFRYTTEFEETVNTYCKLYNSKDPSGVNPVKDFLQNYRDHSVIASGSYREKTGDLNMMVYNTEFYVHCSAYYNIYEDPDRNSVQVDCDFTENGEAVLEKISEGLQRTTDHEFDASKPYVKVEFSTTLFGENGSNKDINRTHFYNVDAETLGQIMNFSD